MLRVLVVGALFLLTLPLAGADLRVVYNQDYAPFSWREDGAMKGILIDLTTELGRRTGLSVLHEGYPWERAQLAVSNGDADAFVTLVNPARTEYAVAAPTVVLRVNNCGVTSKSNPHLAQLRAIRTIADAEAFEHVAIIGSGWAKAKLANAHVTWLSSMNSVFQLLLSNRADLFLESEVLIDYNAQMTKVASQLEFLPAVFDTVEFRFQVSKKSPLAGSIDKFNAALAAMVDDGTVAKILARYGHLAVPRSPS